MRQFIEGADWAWDELKLRANDHCIRFKGQEMPPGCVPPQAHVGFEIDPRSNGAVLLVQNGVRYTGSNSEVCEWFRSGEKRFTNFEHLRDWVRAVLAPEYVMTANAGPSSQTAAPPAADELTDMAVVREAVRRQDRPVFLDEDQLFERFQARVLGQEAALRTLASVMVRHCARRHPARPAVLFAIGPSGVGKTRTAEVLTKSLRGPDDADTGHQFLRLDMTEYQEAHRVSQLIGAPQGYVGHGEGSQLVDALRANPRTVVLFDEIEKAHPAILRVLMNAMDAGRLSTASRTSGGREVDCRHAVFMLTSNLDAKEILDELGSRNAFGDRAIEDEVCRRRLHAGGIAPEIVGRIGRFLIYRSLNAETRAEIMALAIAEVAEEYGLQVAHIDPDVIVELMQKVRSQNFGVRPERFLIDDLLGGAFAKAASQQLPNPVRVLGSPYRCEASDHPTVSAGEPKGVN